MPSAIVVVVGLHMVLPSKYGVNPPWVLPVLLALLAALIIGDPGRIVRQKPWLQVTTSTVIALLTLANLFAAGRIVGDIITGDNVFADNATGLLAIGGVIWATNVISFGLWSWDLDRRAARAHHPHANPAFVFAEMQHTSYTPADWVPEFADYLSLSFWTATAFSPTDISAIKRWAKLLMMTAAVQIDTASSRPLGHPQRVESSQIDGLATRRTEHTLPELAASPAGPASQCPGHQSPDTATAVTRPCLPLAARSHHPGRRIPARGPGSHDGVSAGPGGARLA